MRCHLVTLISLTTLTLAAPLSAQTAPAPVAPSGPWGIDYGETRCELRRSFGTGRNEVVITLAKTVSPLEVSLSFNGPGVTSANLQQATRVSFTGSQTVAGELRRPSARIQASDPPLSGAVASLRTIARDADVIIGVAREDDIRARFAASGFAAALAALESCQDDLYVALALDGAALRQIAIDAIAIDEPRWATTDDIPRGVTTPPGGLTVLTRLDIAASGAVDRCTIMESSANQRLDLQSCRVLLARARYQPARDSAGEAVPTVQLKKLRWMAIDY